MLNGNNLSSLTSNTFNATPNLMLLSMSHNNLEHIEDGTFKPTRALEDLQLATNVSFNKLTKLMVPTEIFLLDASHNRIRDITPYYSSSLTILNLSHNNLIDTAWLLNFPSMRNLDLSYNELEEISARFLRNSRNLVKLNLKHNRLLKLDLYSKFRNLRVLDVSHNDLVYVNNQVGAFESLQQLYLDHNSIVTVNIASNHSLQNLTMSHNDWDCKELLKYSFLMEKLNDVDQYCREGYQFQRKLCCKETVYPYLDQLNEQIKLTIIAEKVQRADGRCSANGTLASIQNLTSFAEHIEARRRYFQTSLSSLQQHGIRDPEQQEQLLKDLRTEIDKYIWDYGVSKQGLVEANVNLDKVFSALNERYQFHKNEAKESVLELKKQQDAVETLNNTIIRLKSDRK
uniref:Leucine rich immune protein (Short) n=1 Tax=Anopheles farauti TaxID=69004 RepID=A0A182QGR0_9DIPT